MFADRFAYSTENCSLMRALTVVGERWTLLVLREAFLGVRRFDDFQRAIGCARNVLAARLCTLVENAVLRRVPYREPGRRLRYEYRLTHKGRDLAPSLIALTQWGDRYAADPEGAPVLIRHRSCGEPARAIVACAGHGELAPRDLTIILGPGAKRIA
jgi:DNA-binding HxlR family transcriptional regulator